MTDGRRVLMREGHGWRHLDRPDGGLWFKGHLHAMTPEALGDHLAEATDLDAAAKVMAQADGHFAVVLTAPNRVIAATDPCATIPLLVSTGAAPLVSGQARLLAEHLGLGLDQVDPAAARDIAMAGYTFGARTLYHGLDALRPGELAWIDDGGLTRHRYATYRPRPLSDHSADSAADRRALADLTLGILEKMVAGLGGRTVMVPLSAGLDSRAILSGLKELGYANVRAFSYGQTGNHEALAAKRIAERLGYDWTFIAHTPALQAATFASEDCRAFERLVADPLNAIPFQQDLYAVGAVKASGYAPPDAVFVNGQSGDYISGNHVPATFWETAPDGPDARRARLVQATIAKHMSLWGCLLTPEGRALAAASIDAEAEALGGYGAEAGDDFGLFEAIEFQNRQSKYVIAGQRTYEWYGFDWRLPLWDLDYLTYWRAVPLAAKRRQTLYRRALVEADWGGVWGEGWWPGRVVVPRWAAALRLAAKAAHAPLGAQRWHAFERRVFNWLIDPVSNYAVAPYGRVLLDRRGHRNAISWHVEAYLTGKGLTLDGCPLATEADR